MNEEMKCPFEVGQTVKLTEEGRKLEGVDGVGEFVVTRVGGSVRSNEWLIYGHDDGAFHSNLLERVALERADYAGAAERKLEDWPEADAYAEEVKAANEELIKALRVQNKSALREAEMWRKKPNTVEAHRATEAVCDTGLRVSRAAVALIQVSMASGEESQRWLWGGDVK